MKHSDSIAKVAAALVAVQGELKAVGKDSLNPHFKNRYASLDNIVDATRPVLAKHGLAVVQGATIPETNAEGKLVGFAVETMLLHSSGEWIANAAIVPVAKADPQGAGGALTYGRRYGLSALLSLSTDEDDDGSAASKGSGAKRAAQMTGTGDGISRGTAAPASAPSRDPGGRVMPFGKSKGTPLGEVGSDDLRSAIKWCKEKAQPGRYDDLVEDMAAVLVFRNEAAA